jgi:hypothetical protein
MKTRLPFRIFLRDSGRFASGRGETTPKATGDICSPFCFLVWLQDWRFVGVVTDFAHCLDTNAMNNLHIDIENMTHLSITPRRLKLIAKYAEEGENLGLASRSGIVCQEVQNTSCITRRQLLDEASMNGIHGSRGSA